MNALRRCVGTIFSTCVSLPMWPLVAERSLDAVQNIAKVLADVFDEKSQHEVTVFL